MIHGVARLRHQPGVEGLEGDEEGRGRVHNEPDETRVLTQPVVHILYLAVDLVRSRNSAGTAVGNERRV